MMMRQNLLFNGHFGPITTSKHYFVEIWNKIFQQILYICKDYGLATSDYKTERKGEERTETEYCRILWA